MNSLDYDIRVAQRDLLVFDINLVNKVFHLMGESDIYQSADLLKEMEKAYVDYLDKVSKMQIPKRIGKANNNFSVKINEEMAIIQNNYNKNLGLSVLFDRNANSKLNKALVVKLSNIYDRYIKVVTG